MLSSVTSAVHRTDYLTREEALTVLRVKPQTLYCYVSRGYIRSVPQPDGRSSFYAREDVDKMKAKSAARAGHGAAAAGAMRWGEPVIQTAITEITADGPRYRSRLAIDLVRANASFETVAEFLWTGQWFEELVSWRAPALPSAFAALFDASAKLNDDAHVLQLMSLLAGWLGIAEGPRVERVQMGGTPVTSARRLIRAMTGAFGILGTRHAFVPLEEGESIAAGLTRALDGDPSFVPLLNGALTLVADHELNPATFAARIASSGGADVHSCVGSALDVHYGSLVGRGCDQVEQLFSGNADPATVVARVQAKHDAARKLPGFNHPLYPDGDPRARYLITLAREHARDKRMVRNLSDALLRIENEFDAHPTVETGLVFLCRALGLPYRSAGGIYALGRSAGWVAHVLEQRLAGFVIRPRAKYVGAASAP